MKNKKITYGLLLAVVVVWGFAIVQIFSVLGGNETRPATTYNLELDLKDVKEKEYSLLSSYRDPFLGNKKTRKRSAKVKKPSLIRKEIKLPLPVPIDLSFIKFSGMIRNQKTGKEIALITINSKNFNMVENDTEEGVTFIKGYKDSIQILWQDKKYFIKK